MIQTSTVYFNEIEDRIDASFYQKIFLELIRRFKEKNIEIKRLEDLVVKIDRDPNFYNIKYVSEGIPVIRGIDIHVPFIDFTFLEKISLETHKKYKRTEVQPRDIIMSVRGVVGRVGQIPKIIERANISPNVILIRLKDEALVSYVNLIIASSFGRKQIKRMLVKSIQETITVPYIERFSIPIFPPLIKAVNEIIDDSEQKHIESINKINQAKQIFEEAIDINYRNIKEEKTYSVSLEDLTNILTPKFYYPKYLNTFKQLRKKFETVKLGNITDIKRGNEVGSRNYKKYLDKKDSDVPFVRTSDLVNYEIDSYPDYYIDEEIYDELSQDLKEGDLLVSNDGKIGLLAILTKKDKCIIQSHIRRVRFFSRIDPYYALAFLSTDFGQFQFKQFSFTQATIPTMSNYLAEIEIPLIDLQKQKEISKLVKEAFKLKGEKKKLIKEAMDKVEKLID